MWVLGLPLLYPLFLTRLLSVVLNISRWVLWGSKQSGYSYSPLTSTKKLLTRRTRRNNTRNNPRRKNNAPHASLTVLIQKLVSRSAYSRHTYPNPLIITVCLPWLAFEHIFYLTRFLLIQSLCCHQWCCRVLFLCLSLSRSLASHGTSRLLRRRILISPAA